MCRFLFRLKFCRSQLRSSACPKLWEHSEMSGLFGQRAVVVGAGIGGLAAAGALAQYFERVEILERDRLTAHGSDRGRAHPKIGTRMVWIELGRSG
jgi:hypothetical protein